LPVIRTGGNGIHKKLTSKLLNGFISMIIIIIQYWKALELFGR